VVFARNAEAVSQGPEVVVDRGDDAVARYFRRKTGANDRGAEAVEFALVVPLFLLLVFGIIDFGFMINRDTMVNNASREGAREGALNPNQAAITAKVRQELATVEPVGTTPSKITVTVTCRKPDNSGCSTFAADAASGGTVIIKVDYQHSWITPVANSLMSGGITLSKTTEMRIE
jgi:Flp pilus assembly protein TadG